MSSCRSVKVQDLGFGVRGTAWSRRRFCSLTGLLLMSLIVTTAQGHVCDPCEPALCPEPMGCPTGLVLDPCDCCLTCGLALNESCGGQYGLLGRCGEGLQCAIQPDLGQPITGHEVGTCVIQEEVPLGDCDPSKCNAVFELRCPNDSLPSVSSADTNDCCPPSTTCTCKPCDHDLVCDPTEIKVIRHPGTGLPGTCCDVIECYDKVVYCMNVSCDAELEKPLNWDGWDGSGDEPQVICPPDSILLPPVETKYGCCRRQQGCSCRPKEICERPTCDDGLQSQVSAPATGRPGFCCDQYICTNKSSHHCIHGNRDYEDGESWQTDKCTTCRCQAGLVFCSTMQCEAPDDCSWIGIPEGECCPVCRGCVMDDGGRYPLEAIWEQDECTTCQCVEGRAQCQTSACSIQCTHPKVVPGICCPVCDGIAGVTLPPHCPLLPNCNLTCPYGMVTDEMGCYMCQCKTDTCDLDCPNGFLYDKITLARICECFEPEDPERCPALKNCQKDCMYGFRVNREGCQRCRCNKCPPFVCKKKCSYGYRENQRGCKLCRCRDEEEEVTSTLAPTTPGHGCRAVDGREMEDGESWHDGCRRCFCYEGHEMCAMITCPVPHCPNPLIKRGDCCPTCANDSSLTPGMTSRCSGGDGQPHVEGEVWTLDECTRCICHDGGILCEIESCPPVLCHHPVKLPNNCCLVCLEGSGLLPGPALPSRRVCRTESGTKIDDGDSWRVNACQSCTCHTGQIHCFSQTCPLLSCNRTIIKKGQCCPTCIDERPLDLCLHDGAEYESGESWLLGECTRCICEKGTSICTNIQCPPLDMCTHIIHVLGRCCPVCLNATLEPVLPSTDSVPNVTPPPGKFTENALNEILERASRSQRVTVAVMVALILLLCAVIILLLLLLLRTRRKTYHSQHRRLNHTHARPKSTNVDLQGVSPLAADVKPQNYNVTDVTETKFDPDIKLALEDLPQVKLVNGDVMATPPADKPTNTDMSHDNMSCNISQ